MYDHRYTGYGDGEPRQQFDTWQQCRDLRDVITHLTLRADSDGKRTEPKDLIEYAGQDDEITSNNFPEIVTCSARWTANALTG